jgi:ABC transporter fused permease/ATP-binding protein
MAKGRFQDGGVDEIDKKKVTNKSLGVLRKLLYYIKPYQASYIWGIIFLLCSSLTFLSFPYVMGKLVDVSIGKSDGWFANINFIAGMLIGILVLQAIFSFFRTYLFSLVSENAMADIRTELYSKLVSLPLEFFEKRRVGELTSRISSDVTQLQDVLSLTLAEFFRQISVLLIGVGILLVTSTKLTLFMLLTFPVLVLVALFFGKSIRKLSKKTQDELAGASVVVEETLQTINTVKVFTNELFEINRYQKSLRNVVTNALLAARNRAAFVSLIIFALFGGIVLVLWFGAELVSKGEISIGDLTSFVIYTSFIGASVAGLGDMYGQLQKTIGASERIIEILGEESEVSFAESANVGDYKRYSGYVKFDAVKFSYPTRKDMQVLSEIDLEIFPGNKIALVGQSGSGKTTITQLLLRFYQPDAGEISIDNLNIKTLDITELRKNIGIVPQEILLFGGTIRENIGYGKPNATEEEIIEAARKANALNFILSFPEGLETLVGERGVKLSGGQRQRIAIARAILKNPPILILDEATSSLDAESEKQVQIALDELMKDRTTLIIAHRLSTIRSVDKILVLNQGSIVESGTHDELLKQENGVYRNLLSIQTQTGNEYLTA